MVQPPLPFVELLIASPWRDCRRHSSHCALSPVTLLPLDCSACVISLSLLSPPRRGLSRCFSPLKSVPLPAVPCCQTASRKTAPTGAAAVSQPAAVGEPVIFAEPPPSPSLLERLPDGEGGCSNHIQETGCSKMTAGYRWRPAGSSRCCECCDRSGDRHVEDPPSPPAVSPAHAANHGLSFSAMARIASDCLHGSREYTAVHAANAGLSSCTMARIASDCLHGSREYTIVHAANCRLPSSTMARITSHPMVVVRSVCQHDHELCIHYMDYLPT